jgi:crossover junction endodeoxyribonuclease RusA
MTPIRLPWPSRDLHPNSRSHWSRRAKAAKQARESAGWEAKALWHGASVPNGGLRLLVTFYPPDKRRRDLDGCYSSIKAHLDGIADAMRFNDSRIVATQLVMAEPKKGGEVVLRLEAA